MKVTPEDFKTLENAITATMQKFTVPQLRALRNTVNYVDDQYKAFRWLMFHASSKDHDLRETMQGYDDAHIDTALKKIPAIRLYQ